MSIAVYREMAINYDGLVGMVHFLPLLQEAQHMYVHDIPRKDAVFKQLKSDILYAQIPGIRFIEGFYMQIGSLKGKGENPEDWKYANEVLGILNQALKSKQLDKRRLLSFLPAESKKLLKDMDTLST